jgi:hypothetical protein
VVTCTESATEYKNIALGAFLDAQGALDRSSFDIIKQTIERHGTEPTICRWICAMLDIGIITATLSEETVGASAARGCPPKGGVLLTLLWSLVVVFGNSTAMIITR